jgi:hypothetical protein
MRLINIRFALAGLLLLNTGLFAEQTNFLFTQQAVTQSTPTTASSGSSATVVNSNVVKVVPFAEQTKVLFTQQAEPQVTPTATPSGATVTVVNTDAAPVPVKVVPADPNGGVMENIALNDSSPDSVHYVDLRPYRYFSLLGNGNAELYFVDDRTTPSVRVYVGYCARYAATYDTLGAWYCANGNEILSRFEVGGPFLEIRPPNSGTYRFIGTAKIYLQK